jgi:hypothetical protein
MAAGVTIVSTLTLLGGRLQSAVATTPAAASATMFLVGDPILEGEPLRVVRMRVPAAALETLGVRSTSGDADVDVDVIVGEDGVARAISIGM